MTDKTASKKSARPGAPAFQYEDLEEYLKKLLRDKKPLPTVRELRTKFGGGFTRILRLRTQFEEEQGRRKPRLSKREGEVMALVEKFAADLAGQPSGAKGQGLWGTLKLLLTEVTAIRALAEKNSLALGKPFDQLRAAVGVIQTAVIAEERARDRFDAAALKPLRVLQETQSRLAGQLRSIQSSLDRSAADATRFATDIRAVPKVRDDIASLESKVEAISEQSRRLGLLLSQLLESSRGNGARPRHRQPAGLDLSPVLRAIQSLPRQRTPATVNLHPDSLAALFDAVIASLAMAPAQNRGTKASAVARPKSKPKTRSRRSSPTKPRRDAKGRAKKSARTRKPR